MSEHGRDAGELPLDGHLAEFRSALRDEIEAARRAASSAAVALINGRKIAQVALAYQYSFTVESPLNLPDGAPGDLIVSGRRPVEATVVSIDGFAITLSVPDDFGEFVPRASLQSSLMHLLRKLIERIEDLSKRDNPGGSRLLGHSRPLGKPIAERIGTLNASQATAVASALGRDTTFIWGPPGTGKTRTIGTIGEELWKAGRSALLVSHTNAAVDQALLHIASALGPDAEDGSVLRLGTPKDLRLAERPLLLAETHVRARGEQLEGEETELRSERRAAQKRIRDAQALSALARWLGDSDRSIRSLRERAELANELDGRARRLDVEAAQLATEASTWERRASAATAALVEVQREEQLADEIASSEQRSSAAVVKLAADTSALDRAREVHERASQTSGVGRLFRRLPSPESQVAVVESKEAALMATRTTNERSEKELRDLRTEFAEVRSSLGAFETSFGDTPGAVLEAASDFRGRRERGRRDALEAQQELEQHVSRLESAVRELWSLLEHQSLPRDLPSSIEACIEAIDDARPRAIAATGGRSAAQLESEARELESRIRTIDERLRVLEEQRSELEAAVLADARIVATTLTRAYLRDSIQNRRFDTVILDEASMAPIPALWAAAATSDRSVVIVGDFRQLPPIKHSPSEVAERWLGTDIFDASGVREAYDRGEAPEHLVVLKTQYRMHPQISAIPNELIYERLLENGDSTADDAELDGWYDRAWGPRDDPVLLVDTESLNAWVTGVGGRGRMSRLNFLSATVCVDVAQRMLRDDRLGLPDGSSRRILIAAPYRAQARLMELMLEDIGLHREVVAGTAHTFQGSEAPVVIVDLVNDEPHWRVGLFDPSNDESSKRLLNVALTRARHRLVVVGDFAYIDSKGRRAFLGRDLVPFLTSQYATEEARELVGSGLAARAARARLAAVGGPIEPAYQRLVVTQDDFYALLGQDLAEAAQRVVIYSPFITASRLAQLEVPLKAAVERGVRIHVVTKTAEERGQRDRQRYRELELSLDQWGVQVLHKRQMHEKLVFVDDAVLWSGSLNPLSYSETQEVMERRASERVVADYANALRLHDLLEFAASDDSACPICNAGLAMAEGRIGEPYWRCPADDCDYTRSIGQPAPRDGRIVCASPGCGAPVEFGFWGQEARWRCTKNARHRQRIAKSHLRLPRMRSVVPATELTILDRRFNLDAQTDMPTPTAKHMQPARGTSEPGVGRKTKEQGRAQDDDVIADLQARLDALTAGRASSEADYAGGPGNDLDRLRQEVSALERRYGSAASDPSTPTSAVARPTPRERELLRLLAMHRSRREMAGDLGLSVQTIKTYLRDLYRKLGVHDRDDALQVARRRGWL